MQILLFVTQVNLVTKSNISKLHSQSPFIKNTIEVGQLIYKKCTLGIFRVLLIGFKHLLQTKQLIYTYYNLPITLKSIFKMLLYIYNNKCGCLMLPLLQLRLLYKMTNLF